LIISAPDIATPAVVRLDILSDWEHQAAELQARLKQIKAAQDSCILTRATARRPHRCRRRDACPDPRRFGELHAEREQAETLIAAMATTNP